MEKGEKMEQKKEEEGEKHGGELIKHKKRKLKKKRPKTADDGMEQYKFINPAPYVVKSVSTAPEAKKNEMMFERILGLLLNIRTDIITPSNKEHLDKVQQLLQNCVRRMMNELHRIKKVQFTQRQILIFKATPGIDMGISDEAIPKLFCEPLDIVPFGPRSSMTFSKAHTESPKPQSNDEDKCSKTDSHVTPVKDESAKRSNNSGSSSTSRSLGDHSVSIKKEKHKKSDKDKK